MSKDMKEAAKQYAEIEMKKVLNVRATAERSFIAGADWQKKIAIDAFAYVMDYYDIGEKANPDDWRVMKDMFIDNLNR